MRPSGAARQLPFPIAVAKAALATGRQSALLSIVLDLRAREQEAMADPLSARTYLDVLPWYLVAVGEHRAAAAMEARFRRAIDLPLPPRADEPPFGDGVRAVPAVATILAAAADRRVVMFNEEHRSSVQRAFLGEIVAGLAEAGFTHLALEAVNANAYSGINERGHPVLGSGMYTLDPALAGAIRRARAQGLEIVAYDYPHPDVPPLPPEAMADPNRRENHREANAARHLQDLLRADPKARLIVYAGRGHISERAADGWNTMCARLKQATGIDPLTVELTHMVEFDEAELEHDAYRHATSLGLVQREPVVLARADGSTWSEMPGGYDVSVFHPRTRQEGGRPHYLQMGGHRRRVAVAVDRERIPGPALLQVRRPGEAADAVPIDQVILWPNRPTPDLILPQGRYTVHVLDREGEELHRDELSVGD